MITRNVGTICLQDWIWLVGFLFTLRRMGWRLFFFSLRFSLRQANWLAQPHSWPLTSPNYLIFIIKMRRIAAINSGKAKNFERMPDLWRAKVQ